MLEINLLSRESSCPELHQDFEVLQRRKSLSCVDSLVSGISATFFEGVSKVAKCFPSVRLWSDMTVVVRQYFQELGRVRSAFATMSMRELMVFFAAHCLNNNKSLALTAIHVIGVSNAKLQTIPGLSGIKWNFNFVGSSLLDDKDVVLAMVEQDGYCLFDASSRLQNDKEVAIVAVNNNHHIFSQLSQDFKNDKDVALAAILRSAGELSYAGDILKNDQEIVLAAVTRDGLALRYASEDLQDDPEIALIAVVNETYAIHYVSDRLKQDEQFLAEVRLRKGGSCRLLDSFLSFRQSGEGEML
jgi:hypothetical protein